MKKTFTIITCFFILITTASAQYMPAVNRMLNQHFTTQRMNMQMLMNRRSYGTVDYNENFKFFVTMKDSTIKEVKSKIYNDTILHKNYLVYVNKDLPKSDTSRNQKIYTHQTLQIKRIDVRSNPVVGTANDSCWVFKVINGPISAYTFLAETPMFYDPNTIVAIQKGNEPMEPFREKNLKEMIKSDAVAMEAFLKKDYHKAIKKYNKNTLKTANK